MSIARFCAVAGLLLAFASPSNAITITIPESFEYADSPANHGWTIQGNNAIANTSTTQAHDGSRSLNVSRDSNVRTSLSALSIGSVSTISVWYFDQMLSGPNWDVSATVSFVGGSCQSAAAGFYNPSTYYLWFCGAEYGSSIARSAGWHLFEWRFGPQLNLAIDGIVVASQLLSGEQFGTLQLSVGSEEGLEAYFDSVNITTVPAPPSILTLAAGLIPLAALGLIRRRKQSVS